MPRCLPSIPGLQQRATAFLGVLLLGLAISVPGLAAPRVMESEPAHRQAAIEVLQRLETRHYARRSFANDLSQALFDDYLQRLDGGRAFFLAADIAEFEAYRDELHGRLRDGDLTPAFEIFNRYLARAEHRLEQLLEAMPELVASLDLDSDETLQLDRTAAAWPANMAEADEIWRKRVQNRVIGLKLAGKEREETVELLQRSFRNQLQRLRQHNAEDVFQIYINSMTELYDPHTNYLSPRVSENFNINMSLKLEGIGALLQMEDEFTRVVRLIPAGPAQRQGELQPADRIVGVAEGRGGEFQDVVGWRLDDVVQLIRGPKGSLVRLEVIPADTQGKDQRRVIEIVRNEVKLEDQSASKHLLEVYHDDRSMKVGVIVIPTFYNDFRGRDRGDPEFRSTTRDVHRLLTELIQDEVDGIIIDLRNNGGGSLQEAHDLTGLFIDSGPTVQIRHANSQVRRQTKTRSTPYYDGPLAVMINRLSASASEIFAGAIQDYGRGIIVGEPSFGKGTVQSLTPLSHGQLKLTESKFYRISGDSTQHRGVVPDIAFPVQHDSSRIGESALERALPWDRIDPVRHRLYYDIASALPGLTERHQTRIAADPDFAYLNRRAEMISSQPEQKQVSLNLELRRQQLEDERTQRLELENQRREARGLARMEALQEDEDAAPDAADSERKKDEDVIYDPEVRETAHILLDASPVYREPLMAHRKP